MLIYGMKSVKVLYQMSRSRIEMDIEMFLPSRGLSLAERLEAE